MDIVSRFERDVTASFGFLKSDFGFQSDGISADLPEISAKFHNESTEVTIIYEAGGPPWVRLANLRQRSDPAFSLELLIEERSPGDAGSACGAAEPGTEAFRACLDEKAKALRKIGSDVLRGDFGILPRMRVRLRENEARRSHELFSGSAKEPKKGS